MGEGNKHDAIIIFGDTFTFPEGNAATNRVYTFAKGFHENGIEVFVVCFRNDYVETVKGTVNGIHYHHPFNQTKRSSSFFRRRWVKLNKYFSTYRTIKSINKEFKIIAINLWTNRLLVQLFVYFLGLVYKPRVIHEHSEHPLREFQKPGIIKFWGETKSYFGTKLCDGIFCISKYLINFYKDRGVDERKLLLVPSTVDTERFINRGDTPLPYEYILYCGSLTIQKDGVDILIDSFHSVSREFPDIKLALLGRGDSLNEELLIKRKVKDLGLTAKVQLLGHMSRNEVPAYICHAKILALARPKSIVADAGFPSKLTEYLSTGKPVVVTKVGEIPIYLKDRDNAFLAEPDNAKEFAGKLREVLDNYEFALTVGNRGKILTETVFNYNYQAVRMLEFMRSLNTKPQPTNPMGNK
jgi:glycosyltransferase involved in cell wall biosynthesis